MTSGTAHCPTCADEAVAVRVIAVEGREARVDDTCAGPTVAIDLVPDARPGELLLCHAGIALARVAPAS